MFEEDKIGVWKDEGLPALNGKKQVIEEHVKATKKKQRLEAQTHQSFGNSQLDKNVVPAPDKKYRSIFNRDKPRRDYYNDYVEKNLYRAREKEMVLTLWPWGYWIIGIVAILCGVILIVTARRLGIMSKTLGFVAICLMLVGLVLFLVGPIEMVEGNKEHKLFMIKRIAIIGSKSTKLKWKQIKDVDVVMAGRLDSYNNTIHYRIEFTTITNGHIRCLETTNRKKAKERVDFS